MDFLVIPFHDWKKCEIEGFRTRDAHLLREFENHPEVERILVIDRPTSIAEVILKRRSWKVRTGDSVYSTKGAYLTKVSDKIFVLDLLVLDFLRPICLKRRWWFEIFSRTSVHQHIRKAIQTVGLIDYGLLAFAPPASGVFNHLGEAYRIFFAVDNWLEHPQMRNAYHEICSSYQCVREHANTIITTSEKLRIFFADGHSDVYFISNGVEPNFFQRATTVVPKDMQFLSRPIVGYAGKIQERLDIELVGFLAQSLPDVNFVFIGAMMSPGHFDRLRHYPNIHYLGDKIYSNLPDYLANFDVCIIPHKVSEFTASMDPLKFYEYLAASKPIVSTPVSGISAIIDWVILANDKQEFLTGLQKMLMKDTGRVFDIPREWTWSFKAQQILTIIKKYMG